MEVAFAGVMGAVFGSFLNVLAYRLPRRESLIAPPSHCRACSTPVRPYDNVPIISFLLLHGRCRSCDERISVRYPLVEAATAALCAGAVLAHSSAVGIALSVTLILIVVPAALIDLDYRIIPNLITVPGAVLALALGLALDPSGEGTRLIAGACAGGGLLLAALAYPGGMGMGDVKLAAVMGLLLGRAVGAAVFVALVVGVVAGLAVIARHGATRGRKKAIPFGPFLALGGIAAVFAGEAIVEFYLSHLV